MESGNVIRKCTLCTVKIVLEYTGKTDVRRTVENEMMIFASPDVMLQDMDRVPVVNEAGQTFSGIAGRTVVYAGSHGETPVKIEGIA